MVITPEQVWQWLRKATSQIEYQHVTTQFPAVADQDHIIQTTLQPNNPEDVLWRIVDLKFVSAPAAMPCIYRDDSPTRRAWQTGSIILRSNVANVRCTLELFIKRDV